MDNSDQFGLEFLDLSGVDDHERRWVLASLCSNKKETNFPWFIGDDNTGMKCPQGKLKPPVTSAEYSDIVPDSVPNKNALPPVITKKTPTTLSQYNLTIPNIPVASVSVPILPVATTTALAVSSVLPLTSTTVVPVTNQYYSPQFMSPVATIPMQNYTNIPGTAVFTTYPGYPIKSPVYYGVPPTQPIFVTQSNTCTTPNMQQPFFPAQPNSYENTNGIPTNDYVAPDEYNQNDNLVNGNFENDDIVEREFDQVPADVPDNQCNVNNVQDESDYTMANGSIISENNDNFVKSKNEVEIPHSPIPVNSISAPEGKPVNAGANPSPWGSSNKSWASLFAGKSSKQVTNVSPIVNGTSQPAIPEAAKNSDGDRSCPFRNPKKDCFVDPDCYRMGEFISTYEIDGRTFSLQPRGLINQSNYCYINSILQALMACPPMYNLLTGLARNITSNEKRKKTPVIDGMCKFVKEFKLLPANMRVTRRSDPKNQKKDQGSLINTDIPFEPSWIYKMLNGIRTDLIEGRQEDAEEFLCCLLNNLNDEMLELIKLVKDEDSHQPTELNNTTLEEDEDREWQVMGPKNKGSVSRKTVFETTPITDIFGGSLKSRIMRTGDNVTENTQPFLTLQLNIEKVKTVKEALEALTTKYQLEGLTNSKTNEQVEAWQQVMLDKLPIILVLHLKCFDFQLEGCTKIIKALEFPIDLKIDSKLLSSAKVADPKQKQYKLFSVVYHDGKEATKGHYVTDAFHVGYSSWLRYDDASVKSVQEEHVLNPQGTRVPYLLFYRRSDTIRSR